jgi:flavin reductase (DIM6/NTAB) family NADH-FMN oxidoreductase RutF
MLDAKELRRVMGQFATGVTILTTHDRTGRHYGLTANAFTSLSLDPPLVLACIDRKSETFPHFLDAGSFAVNVLGDGQEELSARFARSGGDKFAGVSYRADHQGNALLAGALCHIECRIVSTYEGGDHVIHVGEVLHAEVAGGLPLLFFQGQYRRLAERPA